jgi:hypothetical protein
VQVDACGSRPCLPATEHAPRHDRVDGRRRESGRRGGRTNDTPTRALLDHLRGGLAVAQERPAEVYGHCRLARQLVQLLCSDEDTH